MLSKKQHYLFFYRLQSSICTFCYKSESYHLFFFLFPIATNLSPVDHLLLDLSIVVFLVDLNPLYHFPYGLLRWQCARMFYNICLQSWILVKAYWAKCYFIREFFSLLMKLWTLWMGTPLAVASWFVVRLLFSRNQSLMLVIFFFQWYLYLPFGLLADPI